MNLTFGASSIFYLVLTIIIFSLCMLTDKTKNHSLPIFIWLILTMVAGLRAYDVGTDTAEYVRIFNVVQAGGQIKEEIGFAYVSKILMFIFNNPTVLLIIYSAIIYGLIIRRLWDYKDTISVGFAIFAFYSFFFFESLNVMRQFIAVAIVFYASRYLAKNNIKFSIYTLIATAIHSSAVLGFIYFSVQFLSWKQLDRRQKRFLVALAFGGLALSGYVLSRFNSLYYRYRHYFLVVNKNVGFRVFALIVIFVLSVILYRMKNKRLYRLTGDVISGEEKFFYDTTRVYYLLACGLGLFGYFYDYMARLGFYFYLYVFVYFGYFMKEKNTLPWLILKTITYVITIYILYQYIFKINGSGHHPYHTIFNW